LSARNKPHAPFERLSDSERHRSLQAVLAASADPQNIYIFAYGSMMWNPLFEPLEHKAASLAEFCRSFCVWSLVARGTLEKPGLALGLEERTGATCDGIVFRLNPLTAKADLEATWQREMYTAIYQPRWLDMETEAGTIRAIAFTVDREHPQYAACLNQNEAALIIAHAAGKNGRCRDYLSSTVRQLATIGCVDPQIGALHALVDSQYGATDL
jgi:cation transport protein ChaC